MELQRQQGVTVTGTGRGENPDPEVDADWAWGWSCSQCGLESRKTTHARVAALAAAHRCGVEGDDILLAAARIHEVMYQRGGGNLAADDPEVVAAYGMLQRAMRRRGWEA